MIEPKKKASGPHKRRFKPGSEVYSVVYVVELILLQKWLYYNHKPMHWAWLQNWSVQQLRAACNRGRIRLAEEVEG